ncbi:COP9 signalosome complex subunit 9 [Chanodichthys erythropterus]|uniref:COP9 signalosome complex subunit 9 n=1 Tax=Chanodichthys erythropterus TaxID=933992 RepID=UPI00351EDA19
MLQRAEKHTILTLSFLFVADFFLNTEVMKPAVDEMFPEGAGPYVDLDEAGGSTGLLMDLAANEKAVHSDFFNDFEDLFDDDDIQ